MQIIKSLNNNMVLVRDKDGMEKICQGKGIGFQKKKGDILKSTDSVERVFVPENGTDRRHFLELFSEIPDAYWGIAEKVVAFAREKYDIKVSDRIILTGYKEHRQILRDFFQICPVLSPLDSAEHLIVTVDCEHERIQRIPQIGIDNRLIFCQPV